MKDRDIRRNHSFLSTSILPVSALAVILLLLLAAQPLSKGVCADRIDEAAGAIESVDSDAAQTASEVPAVGTVYGWGMNASGQLGNGTTSDWFVPVKTAGLTNVIAIAAGGNHSLALKSDGTVWAWGFNASGQLGNGTTANWAIPHKTSSLTNVIAIAAGGNHSLALKSDGTVWAWGFNSSGQLGDDTFTNRSIPVFTSGLFDVIAIAAGGNHSLALRSGIVWAWGANGNGQLGDGTVSNRSAPVITSTIFGVTAIAAGGNHSLALLPSTVWAWGLNANGQLGDGSTISRANPVLTADLAGIGVTAIAAGGRHSLAIASGRVCSWGANGNGQLGDGATTGELSPIFTVRTGASSVTAGDSFSLAFVPSAYPLEVTKNGSGTGSVTSAPPGLDCGDMCSVLFLTGTKVTLAATGDPGSVFTGWQGAGCSGTAACKVTMNGNKSVVATFSETHTLGVSMAGAGTGTITSTPKGINCGTVCSAQFASSAKVSLKATAAVGSKFAGWSGDCTNVTTTCTIPMAADKSVTALFTSEPDIAVSPVSRTFPATKVGKSRSATLVAKNKGSLVLIIGLIASPDGTDAVDFSIKKDGCSNRQIKPNASCSMTLAFAPASQGAKAAQLHIPSNDPDHPVLDVPLSGTATTP